MKEDTVAKFEQYRKVSVAELRAYEEGEDLKAQGITISELDTKAGHPKLGDMVCRDPKKPADQWLVTRQFFEENYRKI